MATKKLSVLCVSILSTLHLSATAQQTDNEQFERIEVVSHKQAYRGNVPIKELPQAYEAITSEQLSDLSISNFQSALSLSSGIAKQNNFGGMWESFAIRGFAGDENLPSAYLINGFSAGRGYSGLRDTSNIETIEVLKGPGSALYGRGEPGGTVNIITKKPQFDSEGYAKMSLGQYNFKRFEGDYTTGISEDVAIRLNGAYENSDSFRDTVNTEKLAFTPSVYARLSDRTDLTYELELVDQKLPFDRGIPVVDGIEIPHSLYLGEPNDGPMNIGAIGHQLTMNHQLNNDWSLQLGAGFRESSFEGYTSETELSSSRQKFLEDGRTIVRQRRYRDYDAKDLSLRAELSGQFQALGVNHNMLIGADAYDYSLRSKQERWRVTPGDTTYAIDIYNPIYNQTPPETTPSSDTFEEQKAWGIYLQDQIDVTERFKVLVSMRYDQFTQDMTNNFKNTSTSQTESAFNPRVGVSFAVNDNVTLYSNYAEGFRPNSGTDHKGETFEPEKSKSMEAGVKFETGDQFITGTLAAFNTEKSNILTGDPVNSGYSTALGEAKSTGIELDIQLQLGDDTDLSFNYAYVNARTVNDVINADWGVNIPAGSQLLNIPDHSANLILQHHMEFAGKSMVIGAHAQHVGERLGETIDPDYTLPSYTLMNIFTSVELSDNLMLNANIENLFDQEYYANSYSKLWTMPGQPLSIKASITYQF